MLTKFKNIMKSYSVQSPHSIIGKFTQEEIDRLFRAQKSTEDAAIFSIVDAAIAKDEDFNEMDCRVLAAKFIEVNFVDKVDDFETIHEYDMRFEQAFEGLIAGDEMVEEFGDEVFGEGEAAPKKIVYNMQGNKRKALHNLPGFEGVKLKGESDGRESDV